MVIFLYNLYILCGLLHSCLADTVFVLDARNSVINSCPAEPRYDLPL